MNEFQKRIVEEKTGVKFGSIDKMEYRKSTIYSVEFYQKGTPLYIQIINSPVRKAGLNKLIKNIQEELAHYKKISKKKYEMVDFDYLYYLMKLRTIAKNSYENYYEEQIPKDDGEFWVALYNYVKDYQKYIEKQENKLIFKEVYQECMDNFKYMPAWRNAL